MYSSVKMVSEMEITLEECETPREVSIAQPGLISIKNLKKKGSVNVKQRNYILNDVGALKKKLKAENKKHDFAIGKEAKSGSNITVPMKASFFEYVKANFIKEIAENEGILRIENAEGGKAATENQENFC